MLRLNLKMAEIVDLLLNARRQALLMNEKFDFFVFVIDLSFLKEGGLAPMQGEANEHFLGKV